MKTIFLSSGLALAVLAGCATPAAGVPDGMKPGQFVDLACDGGKRLAVRAAADGSSVRIRFEGGYELDRQGPGMYAADGWKLSTASGASQLSHHGKIVANDCRTR